MRIALLCGLHCVADCGVRLHHTDWDCIVQIASWDRIVLHRGVVLWNLQYADSILRILSCAFYPAPSCGFYRTDSVLRILSSSIMRILSCAFYRAIEKRGHRACGHWMAAAIKASRDHTAIKQQAAIKKAIKKLCYQGKIIKHRPSRRLSRNEAIEERDPPTAAIRRDHPSRETP